MALDLASVASRYAKQALFSGIGAGGQERLARARVMVCGCGATGGAVADLLARAGVGFLRVVDRDFVEISNLQRQVLYDEGDVVGPVPKAVAAAGRLKEINSEIEVEGVVADVGAGNVLSLMAGCDLVMDGTDNFETRFLVNDAALESGTPWVYCGVIGGTGQTMAVLPGRTACLRCVIDGPPEAGTFDTCDTAGVIGPAVSAVASLAVVDALKVLTGQTDQVGSRLLMFDVWGGTFRVVETGGLIEKGCAACRGGERRWLREAAGSRAGVLCGRNAVQVTPEAGVAIDLEEFAGRWAGVGAVTRTAYLLRLVVSGSPYEITLFRDGRAIVRGTEEVAVARGVYARYVGG